MSSYNNYEGIEAAYTPNRADDIRGRLFFKMAFDKNDPILRESPDYRNSQGFFDGNDQRWQNRPSDEVGVFGDDVDAELGGAIPALAVQNIVNGLNKVRQNANAALKAKMLALFDQVYTFTYNAGTPQQRVNAEAANTAANLTVAVQGNGRANKANGKARGAGVQPNRGLRTIFNFHPAKLTYRLLHGSTGSTNNENLVTSIIGTTPGVGDKVVRLKDNGDWEIKNDAGNWEDLRTYMNAQPACKVVGMDGNARTAAQCNNFSNCVGQENHKNILGANGGNLNATCLQTILDGNNWKFVGGNDEDALKKIDPAVAFWILKGLCFKGVQDDDGVVTVEPVVEWLRKVNGNELVDDNGNKVDTDAQRGNIRVNGANHTTFKTAIAAAGAPFTKFCELLVNYVNSNDDILNGTKRSNVHNLADSYGLKSAVGVKMDPACKLNGFKNTLNGSLNVLNFRVGSLVRGLNLLPLSMIGGHGSPNLTQHIIRTGDKLPVMERFSGKLRNIYNSLLQRLNNMGKDLNQTTRDAIERVFKSVTNSEDQILKVLQYLNRFAEVAKHDKELLKRKGDVSYAELEKAYKTYGTRMGKLRDRGVKLVDILRTLLNGTDEIENNVNLHMNA